MPPSPHRRPPRPTLAAAASALLLLVLTACGSGADPAAGGPGASSSGPPSGGAAFPVTVQHSLGETVVEAEPQRVVTLTDRDTDTALALGVVPVGIHSLYAFETLVGPWAVDALGDARPQVWTGRELSFEGIAALEPDLILNVNSDGDAEAHAVLSGIAPTIALPVGEAPYGASTASSTTLVAQALGRVAEGEALLAGVEEHVAALAAEHPDLAGRTAGYLDVFPGGVWAYGPDHVVSDALLGLGLELSPAYAAVDTTEGYAEVSAEVLPDYDADLLVVFPYGRSQAELEAEVPTLAQLGATRSGGLVLLDDLSFSAASVLSVPWGLDRLVPRLSDALAT